MRPILCAGVTGMLLAFTLSAQLNEHCTVSILNHTAQVQPDGTWQIANVPFTSGVLRARSACVQNGVTTLGQSELFAVDTGTLQAAVDQNFVTVVTPIPNTVRLTAPVTTLTAPNQAVTLQVTGTFAAILPQDLTAAATGTIYIVSNPNLATVSPDGVVTAKKSGTVLVQAVNEGAEGLLQLNISLPGDSDGDGIPDADEVRLGLDPNNAADAMDDPDHDGLTNLEEFQVHTDPHNPDTDGDTLSDGQEIKIFHTNPLQKDSDGDGVPDNIEVATNTNPNDPASFNLAAALKGIHVNPVTFSVSVGSGAFQLSVLGDFKLGGTLDLTAKARGTTYSSSNPQICTFGSEDGNVIGVTAGSCVVTVSNSGFSATATGTVTAPSISFVVLPGFANGVDVQGNFAYVAAGMAGLQIVDVSDSAQPKIVGSILEQTPGGTINADDVRVIGHLAFVAQGAGGLKIVDVSNPSAPVLVGSCPGEAQSVAVFDNRAYVVGTGGISVFDITNPANPALLGVAGAVGAGITRGVDMFPGPENKLYAVIANDPSTALPTERLSMSLADVTGPPPFTIIASLPIPLNVDPQSPAAFQSVRVAGNQAYLGGDQFQIVDLSSPTAPLIKGSVSQSRIKGVAVMGNTVAIADEFPPVSNARLLDVSNSDAPFVQSALDFSKVVPSQVGTAVAMKGRFIYLGTAAIGSIMTEKGIGGPGEAHLFILPRLPAGDTKGMPPQVSLVSPAANSSVVQDSTITFLANASDDTAVETVTFNVNGIDVVTHDSPPYEARFSVPANATKLTITATAIDLGGNKTTTQPVTLNVIPDPLTTVTGRVVQEDLLGRLNPVPGAAVTCLTANTQTGMDGTFTVGTPTVLGQISCSAAVTLKGVALKGNSFGLVTPVPGGVITVGDIRVK